MAYEKLLSLERYSRDFNLRLYNISERPGENCIERLQTLLSEDLGFTPVIENAHRIGRPRIDSGANSRPIIAKFLYRPERLQVIQKKTMLKNVVTVSDDLIWEDRQTKKKLKDVMEQAYEEGKKPRFHHASKCTVGYCKNGGTCVDSGVNAHCSCPANFTGAICEQDVDECDVLVSPCKNGGTCSNHLGGYVCRCVSGWQGYDCAVNVDDCVSSDGFPQCDNGGTCFDKVGAFFCNCTSNYTGLMCQHEDQCKTLKPCHGGTCRTGPYGGYSCRCSDGWTGQNCSIDIDECGVAASNGVPLCHHGATCVNTPGSFSCNCSLGYTGLMCELAMNECESNPCQNGGACLDYPNKFKCLCNIGWTGLRCQQEINECDSSPCQNGGQCHDLIGAYNCTCVLGYSGPNCETEAPCLVKDCAEEFNWKQCNEKCNNHACKYDGTRCSLGQEPWKSCPHMTSSGEYCYGEFKDKKCNPECSTEKCLFDGFDCINKSKCTDERYCNDHFGDAQCDRSCNTRGCLFDGLDCSTAEPQLAKGTLILVLSVTPQLFRKGARSFIRQLSKVLEIIVFIKRDGGGQMIYSRDLSILGRSRREARWASEGTEVHVNLDTRGCTSKDMCFDDPALAARYLAALQSSNKLDLPYKLRQVTVDLGWTYPAEAIPPTTTPEVVPPLYITMLCVGILLFIVGVLLGGKRVSAKLWFPDGFPRHRRTATAIHKEGPGRTGKLSKVNK